MNSFILSSKRRYHFLVASHFFSFLFFGLILFIMIGIIGKHISPNPHSNYLVKSIKESKFNLHDAEIVTLGTSHNEAILANEIKMPLVHMYTGGQNLVESLYLLKYFRKRLIKVKFILLPLTIGSLHQVANLRPFLKRNILNLEPFRFFKHKMLNDPVLFVGGITDMIARDDNWIPVIKKLSPLRIRENKNEVTMNFINRENNNPFIMDRALNHMKHINLSNKQHIESINYLEKITMLANDSDSCLVIYDSPVSSAYLESFTNYKPKLSKWRVPIRDFIQKNRDKLCVYFFEQIWSKSNSKNPLYYKNQDHLNETGAKIFTSIIEKELQNISNKHGKS